MNRKPTGFHFDMNCAGSVMVATSVFPTEGGGSNPAPALQDFKVVKITGAQARKFVEKKHYSRRMSIFWAGFGLSLNGYLEGVIVFGQPSPPIQRYAFQDRNFRLYELARLVIQTPVRNAASFLISQSLKRLPTPCAIVSYADTEFNHCGFVYQATNWIYTGATRSHDHQYLVGGKRIHPMTLRDRGITNPKKWAEENQIETVAPYDKHRYFFLCGTKAQKKDMFSRLKYPSQKYPKLNPVRYDDGEKLTVAYSL